MYLLCFAPDLASLRGSGWSYCRCRLRSAGCCSCSVAFCSRSRILTHLSQCHVVFCNRSSLSREFLTCSSSSTYGFSSRRLRWPSQQTETPQKYTKDTRRDRDTHVRHTQETHKTQPADPLITPASTPNSLSHILTSLTILISNHVLAKNMGKTKYDTPPNHNKYRSLCNEFRREPKGDKHPNQWAGKHDDTGSSRRETKGNKPGNHYTGIDPR